MRLLSTDLAAVQHLLVGGFLSPEGEPGRRMEKEHAQKSSRVSAESQVWPWCFNYKQQLFHFDMLSGVGCDISSTGICLFYTKSSGKTGLPASDGWGAVSEIAVKTRLLGLQAP